MRLQGDALAARLVHQVGRIIARRRAEHDRLVKLHGDPKKEQTFSDNQWKKWLKPSKADVEACWNLGATVAAQLME